MFCSFFISKNSENFKFCSSCGKQRDSTIGSNLNSDDEKIEFVLHPKGILISGVTYYLGYFVGILISGMTYYLGYCVGIMTSGVRCDAHCWYCQIRLASLTNL